MLISKFSDLQTQYKSEHFLANLQAYGSKGDRSFSDWITRVKRIARLTQPQKYNWPEQKYKV